jgi:hypothetical protein
MNTIPIIKPAIRLVDALPNSRNQSLPPSGDSIQTYCFFTNPHPGTEENLPVRHSLTFNFFGGVRQNAVEVVEEADHWLLIEEGV